MVAGKAQLVWARMVKGYPLRPGHSPKVRLVGRGRVTGSTMGTVMAVGLGSTARHCVGLSSEPSQQSRVPSHTFTLLMHVPSGQGSCPGAQVTWPV